MAALVCFQVSCSQFSHLAQAFSLSSSARFLEYINCVIDDACMPIVYVWCVDDCLVLPWVVDVLSYSGAPFGRCYSRSDHCSEKKKSAENSLQSASWCICPGIPHGELKERSPSPWIIVPHFSSLRVPRRVASVERTCTFRSVSLAQSTSRVSLGAVWLTCPLLKPLLPCVSPPRLLFFFLASCPFIDLFYWDRPRVNFSHTRCKQRSMFDIHSPNPGRHRPCDAGWALWVCKIRHT